MPSYRLTILLKLSHSKSWNTIRQGKENVSVTPNTSALYNSSGKRLAPLATSMPLVFPVFRATWKNRQALLIVSPNFQEAV